MGCRNYALMTVLAIGMLLAACDDKPSVPQSVLDQAKANEHKGPKIPTTQELLSGKRTRFALLPFPLTIEVPPGWDKLTDNNAAGIKVSSAGLNILQGYTPSGEVQIQLVGRSPMKQDDLDRMLVAGKKEMAQKPQQIVQFDLRPIGNLKVLERQMLGTPAPLTTYDKDNQPHTTTESSFNWTLSVLIPAGGGYQVCELAFIGLTKSQYDKDKDFLNGILDTLHYAGDSDVSQVTASSPTSAPA